MTPTMYHKADTMPGSSGSAVILERTGEIVGIHVQGGCRRLGGTNNATLISKNKELTALIKSCIASDR